MILFVVPHHNRSPSPTSSPPVGGGPFDCLQFFVDIVGTPRAPAHGLFRTTAARYAQVFALTFRTFARDASIPSSGHYLIRGQARDHSSCAAPFVKLIAILLYDKGRTVSMAVNGHQNGTSSLPEVTYGFIGETRLGEHRF